MSEHLGLASKVFVVVGFVVVGFVVVWPAVVQTYAVRYPQQQIQPLRFSTSIQTHFGVALMNLGLKWKYLENQSAAAPDQLAIGPT